MSSDSVFQKDSAQPEKRGREGERERGGKGRRWRLAVSFTLPVFYWRQSGCALVSPFTGVSRAVPSCPPLPLSPHRVLLLALLLTAVLVSSAAAQTACDASRLEQAVSTYDFGRFNQTFTLLKPCVPDGFGGKEQRVSAYRLMALSYVATDSLDQARDWVRQLLRVDSRYDPNPQVDPPIFTTMVSDAKPRWYAWLWRGNEWYKWAGRGVLAAGAASLPFLLQGDTPEPDLPGPPVFPDQ